MTKRCYIVGCPALGLREAVADATLAAQRLDGLRCDVTAIRTGELMTKADWLDVRDKLAGSELALIKYSGHGYCGKVDGKVETGLYSGTLISHAWLMKNVIAPLRATTKYLIRIYDACYSAGTLRRIRACGARGDLVEYVPRVHGTLITDGAQEPGDIAHYKPLDAGDVVVAACGARQVAYGYFDGGVSEPWHACNTAGRSLFSQCWWASVLHTGGLAEAIRSTNWRVKSNMQAFSKGPGWLPLPPVPYPIPDAVLRKGRGVPDNILRAI